MFDQFRKLYHPAHFQGSLKNSRYFEGWYFKQVSRDREHVLSVIPGVSLGKYKHAFIQILDGITGQSDYFEYDVGDFRAAPDSFDIRIAGNRFTDHGVELDIHQQGRRVKGMLRFSGITPYPVKPFSPGIMGWYAFVPFMECYHGVPSMTHRVDGAAEISGRHMDFSAGKGYMEKDWGTSFPESWVWVQSNHFEEEEVSFMLSVARIPWLFRSFPGFISFLKIGETLYRFATYTGAAVRTLEEKDGVVHIEIEDRRHRLSVDITRAQTAALRAPREGSMDRHIKESVDAEIMLKLSDKSGAVLFEGKGQRAGFERVGEVERMLKR